MSLSRPRSLAVHAGVAVLCSMLCLVAVWHLGRDLNWDLINYHYYAGYELLGGRLQKDFLGAGTQGYLNPAIYLPFFLMDQAGWPALATGITLAAVHSLSLWVVYALALELVPRAAPRRGLLVGVCLALAMLAPLFVSGLGTTFADIPTATLVLAGVWLALRAVARDRLTGFALAGLLFGAAAGLKLTNAVYVLAAGVFAAALPFEAGRAARRAAALAVGSLAGFAASAGWWAWQLWREFGNPFFPWFNAWFRSPDFPAYNLQHVRFMPRDWIDVVDLPVRVLSLTDFAYSEALAPDVRLLAAFAVGLPAAAWLLLTRGAVHGRGSPQRRSLGLALAFCGVAYLLWAWTSSIGRYAMPLLLLIAPVIVASAVLVLRSRRLLAYGLLGLLLVQGVQTALGSSTRWNGVPWSSHWLRAEVPPPLRATPALYLGIGQQSPSFLAPFLHPDSSFMMLSGAVSLAPGRPGWDRAQRLLDRHRTELRTLVHADVRLAGGGLHESVFRLQDAVVARIGARIRREGCETIVVRDPVASAPMLIDERASETLVRFEGAYTEYVSCPVVPANLPPDPRIATVDAVFRLVEQRCPAAFADRDVVTERMGDGYLRAYVNTDFRLRIDADTIYATGWRALAPAVVGRVDEVLRDPARIACPPPRRH